MKILFFTQKMPDPCGAFFHDLYLAYYLRSKGHSVKFITVGSKHPRQGVYRNMPFSYIDISGSDLESANIFCTPHYPFVNIVRKYNERYEKPILITAHFGEDLNALETNPSYGKWPEFLWVISEHICSYIKENFILAPSIKEIRSIRPIIDESSIRVFTSPEKPTGDCITLINANILKGIGVLDQLARRFPDRKFLGIKPYYNPVNLPNLKNIEWMDIQDDIRIVLRKTRILIVPSAYESWGRVGFEAMFNGIPVLYSKPLDKDSYIHKSGTTEGMKEWIQTNAIECDRNCIEDWINAIISLDDDDLYAIYSEKGYTRTAEMNISLEAINLENDMLSYIQKYPCVKKNDKNTSSNKEELQYGGINRFMSGGLRRINRPNATPVIQPGQTVPTQPVQSAPRLSFGLIGGRFGMKR